MEPRMGIRTPPASASSPSGTNRTATQPRHSEFRQITIKDVARLAGVSLMTVSRALNRPELVSAKTRELVRQAVERTGYIPNRLAGGLSGLHTGQVAVLVPSLSNLVFSDLLNGLASVLEPHGMQMMVGNYHYALVLVGPAPRSAASLLRARALPMVETVELIDTPFDCNVGISHQDAGAAMAAYLTQQGYRSAAAVSANAGLERRTSQRIEGFCRYLAANNFPQPVRLDLENRSSISEGGKAMRRILDLPERPEVVFCANDDLAFGAMMACLDAGLRVPEDIGVAGFNALDLALQCRPSITTVNVDRHRMGVLAARLLLGRLSGENGAERLDVGFTVIPGQSTRKPT